MLQGIMHTNCRRHAIRRVEGVFGDAGVADLLDAVFVAMLVVVPVLGASVYLVNSTAAMRCTKQSSCGSAAMLAVTIVLFEIDMRVGWEERARPSPYFGNGEQPGLVLVALWIHLFFAVTTLALWTGVTVARSSGFAPANARLAQPPAHLLGQAGGDRYAAHRRLDRVELLWLAFVARQ